MTDIENAEIQVDWKVGDFTPDDERVVEVYSDGTVLVAYDPEGAEAFRASQNKDA